MLEVDEGLGGTGSPLEGIFFFKRYVRGAAIIPYP
jgi:hypothetical protein